ncbi:MAG: response regulator transcription factor [Firmicutes bacterium]|nr:response regulator transcription factor [Alicyclobacillaceae bacterium]MCL6496451.1 response regulator transcription factor [Bacillota bacterium]
MRVVLVDDHEVVRRGIRAILSESDEFTVVGEARDGEEGLQLIRHARPDLALVDIRMGGRDGPALCQAVQAERLPTAVVILTSFLDQDLVRTCLRYGVRGYLVKDVEGFDLVQSLRKIVHGGAVLDPKAAEVVLQWIQCDPAYATGPRLTPQDIEILRLVAEGLTNREIGRQLYLSENTVKARVNDIIRRLNAKNRIEAVMIAHRQGWF